MRRPLLLDLFCGAGGAAMGYHRAGFDVIGVDIEPQPHYPFEFIHGDALDAGLWPERFDVIHASPPCQQFSQMSKCRPGLAATYPNLVPDARSLMTESGTPYVIENVVGAPLLGPIMICGSGLGMTLQRHRLFESNRALWGVPCAHGQNAWNPAYGAATNRKRRRVPVIGEWRIRKELQDEAMGIDWMTLPELSEAIPPAYTEFIGQQLLEHLKAGCVTTERHNATPLAANYGHWVTCTCGWQSKTYGRQVDALTEHALHVKANKTDPAWTINRWMR